MIRRHMMARNRQGARHAMPMLKPILAAAALVAGGLAPGGAQAQYYGYGYAPPPPPPPYYYRPPPPPYYGYYRPAPPPYWYRPYHHWRRW